MSNAKQLSVIDPNFPEARCGDLVHTRTAVGQTSGVYIGVSPAGVSWVRWLRPGELRTAAKVRRDVYARTRRLTALWAKV